MITNSLAVNNGRFVLPDGMSYRMLVLPPRETMRPELLSRLEQLVADGGIVYGKAPVASPGLQDYPQCDERVRSQAEKLWAGDEKVKPYKKGYVVDGLTMQETLDFFNIGKDVEVEDGILWTHRSLEEMEIYFLTNQSGKEMHIKPSFRVEGLKPQLWDAVTGKMRMLNQYTVEKGRTTIPLTMEADRSWFIVFSNSANEMIRKGYPENFPADKLIQTLDAEWTIDFENDHIAPGKMNVSRLSDWTLSDNELLRYYSGTAVYATTFSFEQDIEGVVFLDLGRIGVIASVNLNGMEVGTTWMAPYRLNVTEAIEKGENSLEIRVVNVWRNRITGDLKLPEDRQTTWLLIDSITPGEELIPSGLMGPVQLYSLHINP